MTSAPTMQNATKPLLSVRNLRTSFFQDEGVTKAVDGASFEVYPGKTLGIVGESGCGKSVTAQSILRIVDNPGRIVGGEIILTRADGSQVDVVKLNRNSREIREIRGGDIGLIFQEPMTSFSPVHTIGAQIIEAVMLHNAVGPKEARARGVEALRSVGIPKPERRIDEYSFELSGGLRQRAMIAVALSCDPRLLIADEPTTALDVTTQAQILDLLRTLGRETGTAIILITHDLGVVAEMADDVLVMYAGRAEIALQVHDQFEDLRLDRHVQRRGRLIGDQHARIAGQCHGDHRPLAHAAGKLVRILPRPLLRLRDLHVAQHLHRLLLCIGAGDVLVQQDGLRHLPAHVQ